MWYLGLLFDVLFEMVSADFRENALLLIFKISTFILKPNNGERPQVVTLQLPSLSLLAPHI